MTMSTFIDGLDEIMTRFDAFLIDQYGVMHDGKTPYPGAVEAMSRLTAAGKIVIVLTNSGKRTGPNMARIEAIGFPRSSYSSLVSSGEVTWQGLRTGAFGEPFEAGCRVHIIGKQGDDYGLDGLDLIVVAEPESADFIVMAGSDCPRTSLDHYSNMLVAAAARHVPALCANPDRMMLTNEGPQPSSGAIAAVYETLGGRVTYVGKPFGAIYRHAAKSVGNDPARVLCIGDSLEHDVLGGESAGFKTALVRTGLLQDIDDATLRDMLASSSHKPTYVLPSLSLTSR
ncbi:TIGR01459 family HAD-type hydrolase [Lichenihabitans sp. PAMC28606]|uniref:TIGR01459 family HAD-type hydrolase n=1 Tax=Lichenihabitans sp. PAMC28606 TaxID=2880932 RepID=UPI001D09D509|nr:TIGR01459 family HAD-type hydrolase [Lichenihabitans sp. PAMC28606]UDL93023.1 TIGR01459 family HAD-type hydrolase [Lichenihabitans sp. PAMC28606]